jgi:hypothetical protein
MQPQVSVNTTTVNVTPIEPLAINYDDVMRITSTTPFAKIASKKGFQMELYITHPDLSIYAELDPRIMLMRYQTKVERKCKLDEDRNLKKTKKGYVVAIGRFQQGAFVGNFGYIPHLSPQGKFYALDHPGFDTFYDYLTNHLLRNFINYDLANDELGLDDYMALPISEREVKNVRFTHSGGKGARYIHLALSIRINNPMYKGDNETHPKSSFYGGQPRYLYSEVYKLGCCLAGTIQQFASNPRLGFDLSQK